MGCRTRLPCGRVWACLVCISGVAAKINPCIGLRCNCTDCRGRSPRQHANTKIPNKVPPKPPLNQVIVTWSELLPNHVTLGKYHLTCHVLHHVIPPPLLYHVTQWHMILGINHMTYQGIGHLYDHVLLHDHLIKHASSVHQVR